MAFVGPRRTRRTNKRLARLRLNDAGAVSGVEADGRYTPREARKVRRAARRARPAKQAPARKPYNPLDPLTGGRLRQETKAAERLEFGPRADELRRAQANQAQTAANTGTYYDDWRQAMREATARVNETNRLNVEAAERRVDTAYQQDKAGVAQRDAAASETAAKLGRGPVQSVEGGQAVEAARSQGNQAAARLRGQAAADTRYMEMRGANVALGKAQALAREDARARRLRDEDRDLARDRGDFRVDFRRKSRQDEREYAAIRKEFGLDKQRLALDKQRERRSAKEAAQATNAQKIIARIYASADKASARAQVRVAKLQLQKGKISKSQYRHIVNEYRGQGGKSDVGPNKPKLQTWERDKVSNAVRVLNKNNARSTDRDTWLKRMQDEGMPIRLARVAWRQYAQRFGTPSRPHDSQQP